jgi:hypothetical protein
MSSEHKEYLDLKVCDCCGKERRADDIVVVQLKSPVAMCDGCLRDYIHKIRDAQREKDYNCDECGFPMQMILEIEAVVGVTKFTFNRIDDDGHKEWEEINRENPSDYDVMVNTSNVHFECSNDGCKQCGSSVGLGDINDMLTSSDCAWIDNEYFAPFQLEWN